MKIGAKREHIECLKRGLDEIGELCPMLKCNSHYVEAERLVNVLDELSSKETEDPNESIAISMTSMVCVNELRKEIDILTGLGMISL